MSRLFATCAGVLAQSSLVTASCVRIVTRAMVRAAQSLAGKNAMCRKRLTLLPRRLTYGRFAANKLIDKVEGAVILDDGGNIR